MTQPVTVKIPEMLNESKMVLATPSVATFERYERRGTLVHATIYVGLAALIAGLLGAISGSGAGLVQSLVGALANFFVFTGLVYYIGKSQGGTGTFGEVGYTFSLFLAPLSLIVPFIGIFTLIPVLGALAWPIYWIASLLVLLVQGYFGFLAVQSSMNITDQVKSLMTLGGAVLGTLVVMLVIGAIL